MDKRGEENDEAVLIGDASKAIRRPPVIVRGRPIHLYAFAKKAAPAAIGRISQAKHPPIGRTRPVARQMRALKLSGNLWL